MKLNIFIYSDRSFILGWEAIYFIRKLEMQKAEQILNNSK